MSADIICFNMNMSLSAVIDTPVQLTETVDLHLVTLAGFNTDIVTLEEFTCVER